MLRGTSIVAGLTLVSRALGFVREVLLAQIFGGGLIADAFLTAQRIPNLLRSIFGEGALTSAFVPTFASEVAEGREEARNALRAITGALLICTSLVSLLGIYFAEDIVSFLAPGFAGGRDELCIALTRIMMPYIACVSLVAMLNGALNSVKIFGAAAFAQVLMNVVMIAAAAAALFIPDPLRAAAILSWSVVLGGVVQVLAQLPALSKAGFTILPSLKFKHRAVRQTARLMLPALLGAAIYQLTVFLSTCLASLLPVGSVSWLHYADRITQLPIGVFSIALASVLLPTLATALASGDMKEYERNLLNALRFTSFVMMPLAGLLYVFAPALVTIAYQRGKFDPTTASQTARAVQAYSFGLWAASEHSMVVRAFVAKKMPHIPAQIGVVTLLSTLILSIILMGSPTSGGTASSMILTVQSYIPWRLELGHVGLCAASSISSFIGFSVLFSLLVRVKDSKVEWSTFFRSTLLTLTAVLLAGGIASLIVRLRLGTLLELVVGGPLFVVVFLGAAWLLRLREFHDVVDVSKRLLRRVRR